MSEIQVWEAFEEPIDIAPGPERNRFRIEIEDDANELPEELDRRVDEIWRAADKPFENDIIFLKTPAYEDEDGTLTIKTNTRGFRYAYAFNRKEEFHGLTEELKDYQLLHMSTHVHLLTKDDKILFGTKKNQFDQISGFSGFPDVKEDSVEVNGKRYLDIYETIRNRLRPEIGYLVDAVDSIRAVGQVYVDTRGLRGTDSDYLVSIDETASNAQKRFKESSQFRKDLLAVDFEPSRMADFIRRIHAEDKEMSKYAMGCEYAVMNAVYGPEEAGKIAEAIGENIGIPFTVGNETGYFKKD